MKKGIIGTVKGLFVSAPVVVSTPVDEGDSVEPEVNNGATKSKPEALFPNNNSGYGTSSNGSFRPVYVETYDGEKNLGEIGPVTSYLLDLPSLRYRSWKSYLDSEIAQTVINRYTTWVVGSGLKLQSTPNELVLSQEGFTTEDKTYSKGIEQRWRVWAGSTSGDYKSEDSFNQLQREAFINAKMGGDVLVILRVIGGQIKVQLIDAQNVISPVPQPVNLKNGHKIYNGVETNSRGKVVAYHVRKDDMLYGTERIKAYNNGFRTAYLYKGLRYRLSDNRGIPMMTAVMETTSKVERYKEATVSNAEESSKVAYQIVHQQYSSGENPMNNNLAKAFDVSGNGENLPIDELGNQLANNVAATTNNQAFNNPLGAEVKPLQSNHKELYFKEFYKTNWDVICATVGIPSEIAMSMYNSNFSASRAALKDWEHTLMVERERFDSQFLSPIYELWLFLEIANNKIQYPGLINAWGDGNVMATDAFLSHRYVGANVPHIDPKKEVEAERLKLGDLAENVPLTTIEQATEDLNGGDSETNIRVFSEEMESFNESMPDVPAQSSPVQE